MRDKQRTEPHQGRGGRPPGLAIICGVESDELGHCIRAWRDRLDPAAAGLPAGAGRRAPGFEEVAPDTPDAEALARLAELTLEGVPG